MKKFLMAAVIAVAMVGSAFALEIQADAAMGIPVIGSTIEQSYKFSGLTFTEKGESTSGAFAIEVGADVFFTDLIGVGARMDFGFPFVTEYKYSSGTTKIEYGKEKDGVTNTAFAFNMFVGCDLRPINTDKIFLILTPGLDLNAVSTEAKAKAGSSKVETTTFGLGANAQFGYKLTENISLTAEMLMAFNFLGSYKMSPSSSNLEVKYSEFIWMPKIGAAYKF